MDDLEEDTTTQDNYSNKPYSRGDIALKFMVAMAPLAMNQWYKQSYVESQIMDINSNRFLYSHNQSKMLRNSIRNITKSAFYMADQFIDELSIDESKINIASIRKNPTSTENFRED